MLDLTTPRDAAIDRRLVGDLIIWLTTVRPDGRPHSVPVWYWWDGAAVLIFSEPKTQKIRNLRHDPDVVLALETRDDGEEVIFFEGTAELTAEPSSKLMPPEFGEKYARLFPRIDSSPAKMMAQYSQPIRVTLTKVTAWGVGDAAS